MVWIRGNYDRAFQQHWNGPRDVRFSNFSQDEFLIEADRSYQNTPCDKILGH